VVSLTLKKQIRKTKQKVGESNRIEEADYCCVVVVSLFSWECWSLKHDAIKDILTSDVGVECWMLWSSDSSPYLFSHYSSLRVPVASFSQKAGMVNLFNSFFILLASLVGVTAKAPYFPVTSSEKVSCSSARGSWILRLE
jgi:hypothetical protein